MFRAGRWWCGVKRCANCLTAAVFLAAGEPMCTDHAADEAARGAVVFPLVGDDLVDALADVFSVGAYLPAVS